MKVAVIGTGYVGLVTGVALADIGHRVTCIDMDVEKVKTMQSGMAPIHEPELEALMNQNIMEERLSFTADKRAGLVDAKVIYIAVGTPQNPDGSADLSFIDQVATDIAHHIVQDVIVVTKSTVPVGTNDTIKQRIQERRLQDVKVDIVSNPEFLREGSAVHDTFHGDRIIIGAENEQAASVIAEMNQGFHMPILKTDIHSAEMIKYASNGFLAAKISFINEVSNLCEKVGANIEDVAEGMGLDHRIGSTFLNAGIGYGGSCFPKDTNALVQIAGNHAHDFELLKSVIRVNQHQQALLVEKALAKFGSLEGKKVALLGLAFKPNTDDMREAASIVVSEALVEQGAQVVGYDPIASDNAKKVLDAEVCYADTVEAALEGADAAFVLTEWPQIQEIALSKVADLMQEPVLFDGRNCFDLDEVRPFDVEYHSIGRPVVNGRGVLSAY